jgi:hypothetical protein
MTINYDTPYVVLVDMLLSVAVTLYIVQGMAMHNIIRKYKLEKELEKFANLFYMETAVILTLITFLICHFVQQVFINGSVVPSGVVGFISGVVSGILIIKWVKKKVKR